MIHMNDFRTKNRSTIAGLAFGCMVATLGITGTNVAASEDAKVRSGLECVKWVSSDGSLGYSEDGYTYNRSSTQELRVFCPITQDITSGSSLDDEASYVTITDGSSTQSVDCRILERDDDGDVVFSRQKSTSDAERGTFMMFFSASGDPGFVGASAYIECDLPPLNEGRSKVHSYKWEEQN